VRRRYLLLPPAFLAAAALMRPAPVSSVGFVAPTVREAPPPPSPATLKEKAAGESILQAPTAEPGVVGDVIVFHRWDPLHERRVIRHVAHLLELVYMAFDQERFTRAERLCRRILRIDPDYWVAAHFSVMAGQSKHPGAAALEFFRRHTDEKVPKIPWGDELFIPAADRWLELIDDGLDRPAKRESEYPEAVHRKLDTMKLDLAFERTSFEDILAFIRDFSGLDILIDAECRGWFDPDSILTFHMKDAVLKDVLTQLVSRFSLAYVVTEEDVVLLTAPHKAAAFLQQK
jgi:hypothetical protein